MLGNEDQVVVAELDVRGNGDRADTDDPEQRLSEAIVICHQEHDLVVPADAETTERGGGPLGARFQLRVGE